MAGMSLLAELIRVCDVRIMVRQAGGETASGHSLIVTGEPPFPPVAKPRRISRFNRQPCLELLAAQLQFPATRPAR